MGQTLSQMYIHLVFSTRGRTDTIPQSLDRELYAYIAEILKANHSPALRIGGVANHVHILFCLDRSKALSDVVREVKSSSSRWLNGKMGIMHPFYWQDGYGAFSISQSHVDAVKHYIDVQKEHHKQKSFKDELRRICSLYGVELNEKYVWD